MLDEKHDKVTWISIHALLAESDLDSSVALPPHKQFLSTLSLRRATASRAAHSRQPLFLSTLSLRRATTWQAIHNVSRIFLSTLSLRRATVCRLAICTLMIISIHALLAESDWSLINNGPGVIYFYPRSPCGERRCLRCCAISCITISIHALLAESDSKSAQNSGALLRI